MRSRLGLKLLGLCALVVGLMAIGAGAAQAEETGGKWTFINAAGELKELGAEETLSGKLTSGTGVLLSEILKKKVEFVCTSFTVQEGKLIKGGTAKGRLTFHGCITKVGGVTQAACEPNAEEKNKGLIKTTAGTASLLLHKLASGTVDNVVAVKPDVGNTLANIEMSELCSIGEKVPVIGTLAVWDSKQEGSVHKLEQSITEFPALTKLFTISETAEHKATIDGTANAFLSGANINRLWAALWN